MAFAACCAAPQDHERSDVVSRALTTLEPRAYYWLHVTTGIGIVRGRYEYAEEDLGFVTGPKRDAIVGRGQYVHLHMQDGEVLLGGRPRLLGYSLWIGDREALMNLRTMAGRPCWFVEGTVGDIYTVAGARWLPKRVPALHDVTREAAELRALRTLMSTPLEELVRPVARPHPTVERIVDALRRREIHLYDARDQLEPWDRSLLPGILFALYRSLQSRHDGEALVDQGHGEIHGYHTPTPCIFDWLCFVSQALRGGGGQARKTDEGRAAEVRSLAIWLLYAERGVDFSDIEVWSR